MDNMDQLAWKKLEEDVTESLKKLNPDFYEAIKDSLSEDKTLLMELAGIINIIEETPNPLTSALLVLMSFHGTSSWDDSKKEEIVTNVSIAEEHCKKQDGRRVSPYLLRIAYSTVQGFGHNLTEFDVDQQEQITKAIDSLHKHVVQSLRRC